MIEIIIVAGAVLLIRAALGGERFDAITNKWFNI